MYELRFHEGPGYRVYYWRQGAVTYWLLHGGDESSQWQDIRAAKARGMAQLVKDTGLGLESLYEALAPGAKPRYDTVRKLIGALGVELQTIPVESCEAYQRVADTLRFGPCERHGRTFAGPIE